MTVIEAQVLQGIVSKLDEEIARKADAEFLFLLVHAALKVISDAALKVTSDQQQAGIIDVSGGDEG